MIKIVRAKNSAPINNKNTNADKAVVMKPKTAKTGLDWIAIRIKEANMNNSVMLISVI